MFDIKKSSQIAFCGLMTALSVVMLFFGSVVWIFAYVAPIVTGLIILIVKRAYGDKSGLLCYISISLLSLFLLPDKESALMFALFFGYYPLIKTRIEKIRNKFYVIVLKYLSFNLSFTVIELLCFYVFNIPFDDFLGKWGILVLYVLFNVVFTLYDKLFVMVSILYDKKLSKYLK